MGAGHGHGHTHGHAEGRSDDRRRLWLVLGVTLTVAVVELVGALLSGSLALLADAGHMFTDTAAIVLALSASYVATLPASPRRTFGYHRAEIFAALVNAVVLLGVCGYLAVAGVRRLLDPVPVEAGLMLVFAVGGLAANLVSLALLAARRGESLNMRGAFLEVLGDAVGSVAAIVAGVVVLTTGFDRADSLASLVIAVLILPRAWSLLGDCVRVLLESAPPGVDVEVVRHHLMHSDGVVDVHDLHAWLITSGMPALSAHVTVTDEALAERGVGAVLDELGACVATHFGIDHATFQVEPVSHRAHEPGEAHA
ncbi:cobalt-zinc-cadmium efflux system protein [Nocardioides scoriae]|uniref:Cobalt-zinc-cadmium efflux system protein n=1 Tax=Nocardioides scoriae TaxID=642780 RepID=A0A1H1W1I3_9ACTN|nr:cation diffusion facilitator family transporter [Nocardioides scoriae]SDS90376.1 cobalt-zinc-cadmium efflux system protein [Nocardioides scoriae]